jgi:hypothetical protein
MDPVRTAKVRLLYSTMRNSGISGVIVTVTMIGTAWPVNRRRTEPLELTPAIPCGE